MSFDYNAVISKMELDSGCRAIESLVKGLYYFGDDDRKAIAIVTTRDGVVDKVALTKNQAYALIEEFKGVCEIVFGGAWVS